MTKGIKKCVSTMKGYAAGPRKAYIYADLSIYYNPELDEIRCYDDFSVNQRRSYIEATPDIIAREYALARYDEIQEFVSCSVRLCHVDFVLTMEEVRGILEDEGVESIRAAYLAGVPLADILA